MADPQPLAATHSAEVWTAFCGTVTLIIGLITVLYNRLNRDIKDVNIRLDNGQKAFEEIKIELGQLKEQVKALKEEDAFENQELDRLDNNLRDFDRRLTTLVAEHNNCIPRRIAMRGGQQ